MNHEIYVIDDKETGGVRSGVEKEKAVEHQPSDAKRAEDGLHLREIITKQRHGCRLTSIFEAQKQSANRSFLLGDRGDRKREFQQEGLKLGTREPGGALTG
jgi:hypothetical protein